MEQPAFVKLASCGNPDMAQDENKPYLFAEEPNQIAEISSFKEASERCRAFIEKSLLGAGNWAGGQVYDSNMNEIARVSYNGRVWDGSYSDLKNPPNEIKF